MSRTNRQALIYIALLSLLGMGRVDACSICIQTQVDWALPFLGKWVGVCLAWILIRWIIRICVSRYGMRLPVLFTKRPWRVAIGFLLLGFFTLLYPPFVFIIMPIWVRSLYLCHRQASTLQNRPVLRPVLLSLQWMTYSALAISAVYSYATFNNPERLGYFMDFPVSSTQIMASDNMLAQGEAALPVLRDKLDGADLSSWRSRNLVSTAVKAFSRFSDRESIPHLVRIASTPEVDPHDREAALRTLSILEPTAADKVRAAEASKTTKASTSPVLATP